jgi:MerR family copper efflux transcriptional regulator
MQIGELARRAGIGVQAIRYYERMKLLKAPKRTFSGYRSYEFADLERVFFIRKTQELGFSLEEIRRLAAAHSDFLNHREDEKTGASSLKLILEIFENKRHEVVNRIGELQRLEEQLRAGVDKLMSQVPQCPVDPQKPPAACPHMKTAFGA